MVANWLLLPFHVCMCVCVFIFCRDILPRLQLCEQEMDEAWHALPLGVPRCHTGKHCHRVVFDCVALCNVLCRHAPPLRWRETAVVFILCWHILPLYWLALSAIVLCLACIANESCDSCRAGLRQVLLLLFCVLNTPLFIILCCVLHALPTSRVTHAVRGGLQQVLLLLFCVFNTPLFIILCCVWHALPTSRVIHAVRGLQHVLLLLFCVRNTPLFYYLLHSCLSGM